MATDDQHVSQKVPSTPGLSTPDTNPAASPSDTSRTVFTGDSSGGLGPPPKSAPGFPARPPVSLGPEAHEKLLKPPMRQTKPAKMNYSKETLLQKVAWQSYDSCVRKQ